MGFYHAERSFYFGGGGVGSYPNRSYFSNYRKALPNGQGAELQKMPTSKAGFAMAHWKERSTLFTLGGFNGSYLE